MSGTRCSTAREPAIAIEGIEESAERNIEAGNKYLRYLITTYVNDPPLDFKNQTLLAFAAYNAGPGGLHRFRERAKAMGLNPNMWFGNVENAAAAIVGRETVQYVSNIYKYYIAYTVIRQMETNEKVRQSLMQYTGNGYGQALTPESARGAPKWQKRSTGRAASKMRQ